ncbi:TnsD family Tn7-like transposition protein [Noviherbaspirillum sp. UKPF54]|uniref:TnsD family Tn7-like transposition protein n=1 Tax=Noviherbaspirillum sp. UKPF54 TaxID=2601898 RepID=UPI00143D83CC|nr:TnsD family Tn7-like transposition protein [Noviherbaspirillum sp. UKPF54]
MLTRLDFIPPQEGDQGGAIRCPKRYGYPGSPLIPDETIYGALSRHHVLRGHAWGTDTLYEMMGTRTRSTGTAFPSNLPLLVKRLNFLGDDIEALIREHTCLPYFQPFYSCKRYDSVFQKIKSGNAATSKISLGMLASRIGAADWLRYCPACASEDLETIGITTWYRVHQLPGVLLCPYHAIALSQNGDLACRIRWQKFAIPGENGRGHFPSVVSANEGAQDRLLLVARMSAEALTLASDQRIPAPLYDQYFDRLLRRNLAVPSQRIRQHQLAQQFYDFWAPLANVPPFDCLLRSLKSESSWLATLCRKPRCNHHPLKHLLLIGLLENNLRFWITEKAGNTQVAVSHATARGACNVSSIDQPLRELIETQRISIRKAAIQLGVTVNTALLHAARLGMTVKRRPKKMGDETRERATDALAKGEAIETISSRLHISASTVNRLLAADESLRQQRRFALELVRRRRARIALSEVQAKLPNAGFKELQSNIPADFAWLYRHDRVWLDRQIALQEPKAITRERVNWPARDNDFALVVKQTAAQIRKPGDKPIRVTINEIGRRTGHTAWLQKYLHKLPQTATALSSELESVEAFQARRIQWCKQQLSPSGMFNEVREWRVFRMAGISSG